MQQLERPHKDESAKKRASEREREREETKTHRTGPGKGKKNFLLPRPFGRLFVECSLSFGAFVVVVVVGVVVVGGGGGGVPFLFRPSFFTPLCLPRILERK